MFGLGDKRKPPGMGGRDTRVPAARMPANGAFTTPIGDAVDVSVTGMQLLCKKKPPLRKGQVTELSVQSGGQRMKVNARLVWTRRGRGGIRLGFEFIALTDSQKRIMEALGRFGFIPSPQELAEAKKRENQKQGKPTISATAHVPDYYDVLSVPASASQQTIHQAYRRMVRRFHPDVCTDDGAEDRFKLINEAYGVLRSEKDRRAYDDARRRADMSMAG